MRSPRSWGRDAASFFAALAVVLASLVVAPAAQAAPAGAAQGLRDRGSEVAVEGTVLRVSDSDDFVIHLDGGGYLPVAAQGAAGVEGTRQRLTLRTTPEAASAVAAARAFGQQGQATRSEKYAGIDDAGFEALASQAEQDGAFQIVETAALGDAGSSGSGTVASAQTPSTAVHEVWAVPITPKAYSGTSETTKNSSQSDANIASAVEQVSDYWSDQTGGKVTFELQDIANWSTTSTTCSSSNFWTFASLGESKAAALGYESGANTHVVIVFPQSYSCGGTAGQATLGYSMNSGGTGWVTGTTSTFSSFVWNHELGHNLSFHHADRLVCTSGTPSRLNSSCYASEYGDRFDVMGQSFGTGGNLSAARAIEQGAWDPEDSVLAEHGTNQYTIQANGSLEGVRGVKVVDPENGETFWIEHRSFVGRDAAGSGTSGLGVGVRILQLSPSGGTRTSVLSQQGNYSKWYYTAGDTYDSIGGGFSLEVISVDNDEAVVEVTMSANLWVGTASIDGDTTYGQTLTAVSSGWATDLDADVLLTYQWYRNGYLVDGATDAEYVLGVADVGARMSVRVTGTVDGYPEYTKNVYTAWTSYVQGLTMTAGSVTIDGTTRVGSELTAVAAGWELDTVLDPPQDLEFAYQWYRGDNKISGATGETYTLTGSDYDKRIKVKVTGSSPGYATQSVTSAKTSGVSRGLFDGELSATVEIDHDTMILTAIPDGIATPGVTYRYQWLRNGKEITDKTSATFFLKSKNAGKDISVRVTAKKSYFTKTSVTTERVNYTVGSESGLPEIVGDLALGSTVNVGAMEFSTADGTIEPAPEDYAYQWYRGSKKISGATDATYTIVGKDLGKRLRVKVTVTADGWLPYKAKSLKTQTVRKYAIEGDLEVSVESDEGTPEVLTATPTGITEEGVNYRYQWLRNGSAITGQTGQTYTIKSKDAGKYISVRVTVRKSSYTYEVAVTEGAEYS